MIKLNHKIYRSLNNRILCKKNNKKFRNFKYSNNNIMIKSKKI